VLDGGAGADVMAAGVGATRFVFTSAFDSSAASMDRITRFNAADGDRIDLTGIDADPYSAGHQAAVLVSAFSETPGEVVLAYSAKKGWTRLSLDVSGDGVEDFVLRVDGQLTADGLVL
jgi:Ca2+-binding RTX toxin-like protein